MKTLPFILLLFIACFSGYSQSKDSSVTFNIYDGGFDSRISGYFTTHEGVVLYPLFSSDITLPDSLFRVINSFEVRMLELQKEVEDLKSVNREDTLYIRSNTIKVISE